MIHITNLDSKILFQGGNDMAAGLHQDLRNIKVLYVDWNCYGGKDMKAAMPGCNIILSAYSFSPQFIFSFDYFPIISLYSYTLANPYNRVFLFDRQEYLFFRNNGIRTVFYLPLAAAPDRLPSDTEPKHQLYHRIQNLPDVTRGYRAFDIIDSQGFLLTNYQEDFFDCFVPDEDFVYYSDAEDLMNKIEYYLSHEKERLEILRNRYAKILRYHTYENRIPVLFRSQIEEGENDNGLFP